MTEKKRRQEDPCTKEKASDSSEDNKNVSSIQYCNHVKLLKPKSIRSTLSNTCKDCSTTAKDKAEDGENICVKPATSDDKTADLWVCLFCGTVSCGEKGRNHASQHPQSSHTKTDCHDLAYNTGNRTVWCFTCNKEVKHTKLSSRIKQLEKKFEGSAGKSVGKNPLPESEMKSPCRATPFLNKEATNKHPLVKGLMNLGNTCFFNSVLQCLAQTPYLVPVLKKLSLEGEKFVLPEGNEVGKLEGELKLADNCEKEGLTMPLLDLLKELNSEGNNTIRPEKLLGRLKERYEQFKGRDQHDAHELLRHLLEGVRSDDHKRYQQAILQNLGYFGKENKANRINITQETRQMIRLYGLRVNELPLGPDILFRGQLISILECQECNNSSIRTENFLDLSLPVTEEKPMPPARKKEWDLAAGLSKYQLKMMSKKRRSRAPVFPRQPDADGGVASNEESGPSDADVEDNVEPDRSSLADAKTNESETNVSESGYSSEKAHNTHSESASPAESGCSFVEPPLPFAPDDEDENESGAMAISCSSLPPLSLAAADAAAEDGIQDGIQGDCHSQMMPKCSPSEGDCGEAQQFERPIDTSDLEQKLRLLSTASPLGPDDDPEPDDPGADAWTSSIAAGMDGASASSQTHWLRTLAPHSASEGECSVVSCLHEFTNVEIMNGANKVRCDNCTRNRGKDGRTVYTTSTKRLLISAPPAVLILHLKRFIAETCRLKKMNRHVTFPLSLDLAPCCFVKCRELPSIAPDQSQVMYSLYGVVEHSGQMYGGHYVAYVKVRPSLGDEDPRWNFLAPGRPFLHTKPLTPETPSIKSAEEKWYYISDSQVSLVDEERVRKSQAYLLFYERIV